MAEAASSRRVAEVGMIVFLASWAVLFAALLTTWAALGRAALAWPPAGAPGLPLGWGALGLAVLALSSALLAGPRGARPVRVAAAAALGAGFLAIQLGCFVTLAGAGLSPRGAYGGGFYALAGAHAVHVALGIVALAARAARRRPPALWAWYWHFVGLVWLAMFLEVYVA